MTGLELINCLNRESKSSESSLDFENEEQYYSLFEREGRNLEDAIAKLIADNTICSMFVLVQILGNPAICQRFGWRAPEENDFKIYCGLCNGTLFEQLYLLLIPVIRHGRLMMKGIGGVSISDLTMDAFMEAFAKYKNPNRRLKPKKKKLVSPSFAHNTGVYNLNRPYGIKAKKYISDYVHGLTDI